MNPDLIANKITDFFVHITVESDHTKVDLIFDGLLAAGGEQRRRGSGESAIIFREQYKTSRRNHLVNLIVTKRTGGITIHIHNELRSLSAADRKRSIGVATALQILERNQVNGHAVCNVVFDLTKRDFKPAIPLPLKIFQDSDWQFDHLIGLRLGKITRGEVESSLIIDTYLNTWSLALIFEQDLTIQRAILNDLVMSGKTAVLPFIAKSREVEKWYKRK